MRHFDLSRLFVGRNNFSQFVTDKYPGEVKTPIFSIIEKSGVRHNPKLTTHACTQLQEIFDNKSNSITAIIILIQQ